MKQIRWRRFAALTLAVAVTAPTSVALVEMSVSSVRAAQPAMTSGDLLRVGADQYKNKQYEESLATLQQIRAEDLSAKDQRTLSDYLSRAELAANQRKAARADFEMGETALKNGQNREAVTRFRAAASNRFADTGTAEKARERLAVAEAASENAGVAQRDMYEQGKADIKSGNLTAARAKFAQLAQAGFKAPLFQKSPGEYVKDIDRQLAQEAVARANVPGGRGQPNTGAQALPPLTPPTPAPAPVTPVPPPQPEVVTPAPAPVTPAPAPSPEVTQAQPPAPAPAPVTPAPAPPPTIVPPTVTVETNPPPAPAPVAPTPPPNGNGGGKQAYDLAKQQYQQGDMENARRNFEIARDQGFKPSLFEDSPQVYLKRMDDMERAAALQAARNAAPPPAPVVPAPAPAPAPPTQVTAVPQTLEPAPAPVTPAPAPVTPAPAPVTPAPAPPPSVTVQTNPPAPTQVTVQPAPAPVPPPTPEPVQPAPAPPPTVTVQTQPPAPAPPGPAQVTVTTEAQPPAGPQTLQATAQMEQIRAQQRAYEAQGLVEQARRAQGENRYEDALSLYTRAADMDSNNQQAIAGRNEMQTITGRQAGPTSLLAQQETQLNVRRQAIRYSFDTAIRNASDAVANNDWRAAESNLAAARVARDSDPNIFTADEVRQMNATIANTQSVLDTSRQEVQRTEAARQMTETRKAQEERLRQEQLSRQNTVADLIKAARRAIEESKYKEAQGILDQILTLDPSNDYALGVRPLVEDKANFLEQRGYREAFAQQWTKQLNAAEEKKIPYDDIFRYPANWPDISATRDASLEKERGVNQQDVTVQAQLDRVLPDVKFDNAAFADAIDWFRDVTGANIFVNWRALEAQAIDKNTPVTARLRDVKFSKALTTVLNDVGGGTVKLAYTIDQGVITISTLEDLSKNVVTRVYDIRDLIVDVPDFDNAPDFSLQSATQNTGGRGGGGGGGGQQSPFGQNSSQGQNQQQSAQQRTERIQQITQLIEETVAADSWRDAGGTVGSIRELSGQLVVTQTPENQRELNNLLAQLREQRAIQVTIETRFLTVQRNFMEDVGLDLSFVFNNQNPLQINNVPLAGQSDAAGNPVTVPQRIPGTGTLSPIVVNAGSSGFTQSPQTGAPGTLGALPQASQGITVSGTYLDDFQVNFLLRATQASVQNTLLTAPRVTLFNGQRAYVLVATQTAYVSDLQPVVGTSAVAFNPTPSTVQSGALLDVQATVSSDRKYVTLTLQPTLSTLVALVNFEFQASGATTINTTGNGTAAISPSAFIQQPIIQITQLKTTVSVPDGGTLLLGGQTIAGEVEKEIGVPILSKIPFLKRLFTNRSMAKDEQVLLILVKPTIIIQREVEEKQFPLLSSKVGG